MPQPEREAARNKQPHTNKCKLFRSSFAFMGLIGPDCSRQERLLSRQLPSPKIIGIIVYHLGWLTRWKELTNLSEPTKIAI